MHAFTPTLFLLLGLLSPAVSLPLECSQYSNVSTWYPNQAQICSIYAPLTLDKPNFQSFFDHVAENVNWTIEGTHPLAGQYNNKTILEAAFARITGTATEGTPLQVSVRNIIGGGNEAWSVQELQIQGRCVSGLKFNNRYAWVTKWNESGIITTARAYLDSALVAAAIFSSEVGSWTYSDIRNDFTPYVTLSRAQIKGATGLQVETA